MEASQIKAHMEVIGSDEQHVGTVDHVDGQRIKLTRKDSGGKGEHRYLDLSMVSSVQDGRVRLSCTADQAGQQSAGR
jgi:hypothetical protein